MPKSTGADDVIALNNGVTSSNTPSLHNTDMVDANDASESDTEDDADITAIRKLTRDDSPDEEQMPHHVNAVKVQKISVGKNITPTSSQETSTKTTKDSLKQKVILNIDKPASKSTKSENRAARREEISGEIDSSNILPEKNRTKIVNVTVPSSSSSESSSDSDDTSDSDSDSDDETSKPTIVTAPSSKRAEETLNKSNSSTTAATQNEVKTKLLETEAKLLNNQTLSSNSQSQSRLSSLPSLSNLLDKKLPELKNRKKPVEKALTKKAAASSSSDSDSSSDSSSDSDSDSDSDSSSGSDSDMDDNSKDGKAGADGGKFMNAKSAKQLIAKKAQKSKVKKNKGFSALMRDSKR